MPPITVCAGYTQRALFTLYRRRDDAMTTLGCATRMIADKEYRLEAHGAELMDGLLTAGATASPPEHLRCNASGFDSH